MFLALTILLLLTGLAIVASTDPPAGSIARRVVLVTCIVLAVLWILVLLHVLPALGKL